MMASTNTSHEEAAVVDANVLIDLFELDRLDLLFIISAVKPPASVVGI